MRQLHLYIPLLLLLGYPLACWGLNFNIPKSISWPLEIPESWDLEQVGERFNELGHSVSELARQTAKDLNLEGVKDKVEEALKRNEKFKALDGWVRETVSDASGYVHELSQNEMIKLVDESLGHARSHCHTTKLRVLAEHVRGLAESLPGYADPDLVSQVQAFAGRIETLRETTADFVPVNDNAWSDFINETSQVLHSEWLRLRRSLLQVLSTHDISLTTITNYIDSGFASTWEEIKTFASGHQFLANDIERLKLHHRPLLWLLAWLLICGESALIAPDVIPSLLYFLGFSSREPMKDILAALWQATYGGHIPKGSWFSLMQKLAMGGLQASSMPRLLFGGSMVAAAGVAILICLDRHIEETPLEEEGYEYLFREFD